MLHPPDYAPALHLQARNAAETSRNLFCQAIKEICVGSVVRKIRQMKDGDTGDARGRAGGSTEP